MKAPYFIDFTKNEIVVTKKFRDAAGVRDSQEFETMMELRKLGMEIRLQKSPARKKAASQITYKKMIKHINCLADADYYMAEFEKTRELSKGELIPIVLCSDGMKQRSRTMPDCLSMTKI